MKVNSTINKLLYVPFNQDFYVNENIKDLLTEEEFFTNCFYMPDFEKEIEELIMKSEEEIKAFEVDLSKEEIVEKYRKNRDEKQAFFEWISSGQNEIYCIKGDAGTGKTTFAHFLKYKYRNSEIQWDIIDMNKSIENVKILNYKLHIPRFSNVFYKSVSVLIKKIIDEIFKKQSNGKIDMDVSYKNIEQILEKYSELSDGYYPEIFVDNFFNNLKSIDKDMDKRLFVEVCAKYTFDYLEKFLRQHRREKDEIFSQVFELYIYFLICKSSKKRCILAFDNLEKFIGTEEIYDSNLINFISSIRHTQKTIVENNINLASKFQVSIFMRNTSTRMFTPLQISELFPHIVDLSEWFQSGKIIQKKIDWYVRNDIEIDESVRLLDIINDIGYGTDGIFRGLRSKLNMLFNNDKRVIVNILTKVLDNDLNRDYLEKYDYFSKRKKSIDRFAKRTIIFRLVLNELRKDGFFTNIAIEREKEKKTSLGYARRILTILYEHKLRYEDGYIEFDDIIIYLDDNEENAVHKYFLKYNEKKRDIISKVLFYMNYYDGRKNNWLQFIDIQYNISFQQKDIKTYKELSRLIDDNHENINIRITNAGIAYLYFVVYSFEYFSCKSFKIAPKDCVMSDGNIPPILCAIPNKEEILEKKIEDLLCVKIMEFVSEEAINCIKKMEEYKQTGQKTIPFRKGIYDKSIEHSNRIINSHTGFINNYQQCMREMYEDEIKSNTVFKDKYEKLENKLEQISKRYMRWV